ncbi:MAG: tetratricopeptide repeat protein [Chloroflexi bacterium]|nr:tetratricopeptide repeat protein [Chloroflexota bacterium]
MRLVVAIGLVLAVNPAPESKQITGWVRATRQGDYDLALATVEQALGYSKHRTAFYEQLVFASLDAEQYASAQAFLYTVVEIEGWNAVRREQLATILAIRGTNAPALRLDGPDLTLIDPLAQARQYIAQGQPPLAQATLETALNNLAAQSAEEAEAVYLLAILVVLDATGPNVAQAVTYLDRIPADSVWAERAGRIQTALASYDNVPLTDAHTALGLILIEQNEWALAERAFEAAVAVNTVNSTALAYLGFARDQQGQDGLPQLRAALEIAPRDPVIFFLLGQHWRGVGDDAAALEAFGNAQLLDSDNPALAVELGEAWRRMADLDSAAEWFRTAVELAPDDIRWTRSLAAFYAEDDYQLEAEGLAFIQQAVERTPDDAHLRTSLAVAYLQVGDISQAFEQLNVSLAMDGSNPRTRYYFGRIQEDLGDVYAAENAYYYVIDQVGRETGYGRLAAAALDELRE